MQNFMFQNMSPLCKQTWDSLQSGWANICLTLFLYLKSKPHSQVAINYESNATAISSHLSKILAFFKHWKHCIKSVLKDFKHLTTLKVSYSLPHAGAAWVYFVPIKTLTSKRTSWQFISLTGFQYKTWNKMISVCVSVLFEHSHDI